MSAPTEGAAHLSIFRENVIILDEKVKQIAVKFPCAETDEFFRRSSALGAKLQANLPKENDQAAYTEWIKQYTQAVLDLTFVEENQLVEDDFPESQAERTIWDVLQFLSKPETLITQIYPANIQAVSVLGQDVMECLYWRRGALLYMYCCTVCQNTHSDKTKIPQFCQSGIVYLSAMLSVRTKLADQTTEVSTNDSDTLQLINKGIYSDTHMLALMYAGEMCYWYCQYPPPERATSLIEKGLHYLKTYTELVKGPLAQKGWSCEKAEELIQTLEIEKSKS